MKTELEKAYRVLNKDVIKYIAMLAMLLNHISTIFMKSGGIVAEVFLDIGYFTAIIMCYFLVEGFQYTRSKKKYAIRLAIFAIISEIPYCLAFTESKILEFYGLNMLFTLLICFFIIYGIENLSSKYIKVIIVGGLTLLSVISDWALLAPIFTLLFVWAKDSISRIKLAFFISMFIFGLFNLLGGIGRFSIGTNILYMLGSMMGIALAGIVIIYLYNGKRMGKGFLNGFSIYFIRFTSLF